MRVLIADDEHLVRYGLKSMIEELELGLTVVGEAATGDELVALATKLRPEVCFVDIRMPGLGGLAAIKKAQKAGCRARWIILSSHAEFDYAAEAIQLGAESYLLKPAGPAQLREVLVPLLQSIDRDRREASSRFEKSLLAALGAPVPGGSEPPVIDAAWAMVIRVEAGAQAPRKETVAFLPGLLDQVRTTAGGLRAGGLVTAAWQDGPDQIVTAASWDPDDAEARGVAAAFLERVGILVKQTAGRDLRATGFSAEGLGTWEAFVGALERLREALVRRLVLGTGTVHALEASERRMAVWPEAVAQVCQRIEVYLEARDRGDIPDLEARALAVRDAMTGVGGATAPLEAGIRHLAFRTGLEVPEAGGHGIGGHGMGPLLAWAEGLAVATRAELPDVRRNADLQTRVVEKVDQYLRQRLATEVRVPDIASALGLTPNYLSSVYHKFTQTTISERLATLRLDQARDLLSRPGSQVKEVAAAVGYKSPRHFARLYHERFGHYPSGR